MPDPYREPIQDSPSEQKIEAPLAPEKKEQVEKVAEGPAQAPAQEIVKPTPVAPPPTPPPVAPPVKEELKALDEDRQLKILVDLAFEQGLDKAVEAARATENSYLIDKFHDTLVDELYQKLMEKGKLKEL